mmetsp:Transcript_39028/g.81678  ORF Transcript_39028/g.81678 Transcript_39028/m.81678 type:complete len:294 (-) Transcript_39028:798-1679(-)
MTVHLHQIPQCGLPLRPHLVLIPLHERQQRLMPQHRQLRPLVLPKPHKVPYQTLDHRRRQRVLLVQKRLDEYRRGAIVLRHARQLVNRHGRVMHGDAHALQDGGDDDGLAEGAPLLAEGEEYALEECGGFVDALFEGHVVVVVELFVGVDVGADGVEEDEVVESLGHFGIEVGGEDAGGGVHGLGRPLVRAGEVEYFFPVVEGGYYLEGFGEFAGGVVCEEFANIGVHLHHLRRQLHPLLLLLQPIFPPSSMSHGLLLLDLGHDDIRQIPSLWHILVIILPAHHIGKQGFLFW